MKKHKSDIHIEKRKLYSSLAAFLVVAALVVGLTRAWFFNEMDIATMMIIQEPAQIAILGPHGSDMTELDLSYEDKDKDENNKVTIRRVICVQSEAEKFKLEIVHTTNLKGLTFTLYPATETTEQQSATQGGATVTDKGYTYAYDAQKKVGGSYINQSSTNNGYRYATNSKHETNYGTYSEVQSHAEPIYWLTGDAQNASITDENESTHKTYFVCEISWTETTKETDIFYILAETAS